MNFENLGDLSQKLISLANDYFGEKNWTLTISNVQLDFIEETSANHFSAGAMAIVRVQVCNGGGREDLGYGAACEMPSKGIAIKTARKKAVEDGLKGAISNFGGDILEKVNEVLRTSSRVKKMSSLDADSVTCSAVANKSPLMTSNTVLKNGKTIEAAPLSVVQATSPLAAPLPVQAPVTPQGMTEEELAKAERKRRQRQKQEEFRQKLILQQLQGCQTKQQSNVTCVQQNNCSGDNKSNSTITHALDVDEDLLLTTQEMEAMVKSAVNTNSQSSGRFVPKLSSHMGLRPTEPGCHTSASSVNGPVSKPVLKRPSESVSLSGKRVCDTNSQNKCLK